MRRLLMFVLVGGIALLPTTTAMAETPPAQEFTRIQDVIYGRKCGMALTLDVFTPLKPNGAAVIWVVSGGWYSSHEAINPAIYAELLQRGYTIFAVVHGSQPKFTILDAITDLQRAVRFIRFHAREYKIDPDRIGISGASAGGHLSLMQGTAGDLGNSKAKDRVETTSSRVQAVACFFPPTDFLHYGDQQKDKKLFREIRSRFQAPFDFHEYDYKTNALVRITDKERLKKILGDVSPITHVSADDPPALIIHGDADRLVPVQQAEVIVAKFKEVGVPAQLVVKKGAAHGWDGIAKDVAQFADWFDKYLKPKTEK